MARWALRDLAEPQGWNPHSLAREAPLSYNTVRPIWTGAAKRVDLATLARLAAAVGVAPGALIAGSGDARETALAPATPAQDQRTEERLAMALTIIEEYQEHITRAQNYKPASDRGEAVSPLLRALERVYLLLCEGRP